LKNLSSNNYPFLFPDFHFSSLIAKKEVCLFSKKQLDKDGKESSIIEALKKQYPPGVATMDLRSTLQEFSETSEINVSLVED